MPQAEEKRNSILFPALNLVFWTLVYSLGRHPDAPWGDGLGYALAVESGWDLATNANSHFLYLNLHHLLYCIFGLSDALSLLGWASVFWAVLSLFGVYLIGNEWKGKKAGLLSMNLLASSFPFWRHASIPEVYTMELCIWVFLVCFLFRWLREGKVRDLFSFFLIHALGLLVHVHLILIFPSFLVIFFHSKNWPKKVLLVYLIPMLVVFWSVWVLKTNTFSQVFFDSIQDQMLTFHWADKWYGPFFAVFVILFMFPAGFLFGAVSLWKTKKWTGLSVDNKALLLLGLPVFAFACLFPDPGIYVFLLPVFLLLSLYVGSLSHPIFPVVYSISGILVFQILFFFTTREVFAAAAPKETLQKQEIKGGPGFLFLPWARGNVASILDKMETLPINYFPENDRWNVNQAVLWKKNHAIKKN